MYNAEEKDRLRKILIVLLAISLLFPYFPMTITRATLPEIELSYDTGHASGGVSAGGLLGLGLLFTPPSGNYSLTKIKFFEYIPVGFSFDPALNDSLFDIEIWDLDRNTVLNLTFRCGDYLNEVSEKWIIVEVPLTPIHGGFWVCIFPNSLFWAGYEDNPHASGRSCAVVRSDHSIFGKPFTGQDFEMRAIISPTPLPSDINSDGISDILDALQLASSYGSTPSDAKWNPKADLNNDGVINILDAIILCNDFGKMV